MAELKPMEIIMRIDFAASNGIEVVAHAEQVQELVRCKDCKWYEGGICYLDQHEDDPRRIPEAYCSVAERREDETN